MPEKLDNRHEIELAEGISVHLSPASLVPRLIARLLDVIIQTAVFSVVRTMLGVLGGLFGFEVISGIDMLLGFLVFWFYDPIFELLGKAASPGKMVMKLRVVKLSGSPTDFASSFLRALLWPIDLFLLGLPGIAAVLSSRHSQRLGDLAAGTLVVHVESAKVDDMLTLPVKPIRPNHPLQREEQLAFLEFGRRYDKLTVERQQEIVECLDASSGSEPSNLNYALGIAQWLNQNEG